MDHYTVLEKLTYSTMILAGLAVAFFGVNLLDGFTHLAAANPFPHDQTERIMVAITGVGIAVMGGAAFALPRD